MLTKNQRIAALLREVADLIERDAHPERPRENSVSITVSDAGVAVFRVLGTKWATINQIVDAADRSRTRVVTLLREMVMLGVVERKRRPNSNGGDLYRLADGWRDSEYASAVVDWES